MNQYVVTAVLAVIVLASSASAMGEPQTECVEHGFTYAVSAFAWDGESFERILDDRTEFETSVSGNQDVVEFQSNLAIYGLVTFEDGESFANTAQADEGVVAKEASGIDEVLLCTKRTAGKSSDEHEQDLNRDRNVALGREIGEVQEITEVPEMEDFVLLATLLGSVGLVAMRRK